MPSTIIAPVFTFGQVIFCIGNCKISSGEITGFTYVSPQGTATVGKLIYEVTYNRETPTEQKTKISDPTEIFTTKALALAAYGLR